MVPLCAMCEKHPVVEGREVCYGCEVLSQTVGEDIHQAVARKRTAGGGAARLPRETRKEDVEMTHPANKEGRACRACQTTEKRIHGRGLCTTCYFREKKWQSKPRATKASPHPHPLPRGEGAGPGAGATKAGAPGPRRRVAGSTGKVAASLTSAIREKAREARDLAVAAAEARYQKVLEAVELIEGI